MPGTDNAKIGMFSALSIGIVGMVGGGIFAVTGLTIELTRGAALIAFIVAGIVALLTSYSYLRLTLKYPSEGGTETFLIKGFGEGVFSGALNILLSMSYMVLLAVYAYAFDSYASDFLPFERSAYLTRALASGLLIVLVIINLFGTQLVIKSEIFSMQARWPFS
ncbi:amino acid permease [Roseibium sp. SCP14]|uniref:amino acid permease n=1 Tax=Roseibium sp. SCP14 TaxID=3141375 RepID=UPI00333C9D1E